MNSIFDSIFKHTKNANLNTPITIKAPAPSEGALNDIYKSPLYHTIRSNIISKQTYLINHFHDMSFVASCADKSFVLFAPFKSYSTGKNKEEREKLFIDNKAFTQKNFKENITISKKLDAKYTSVHGLFASLQTIYPTFGLNIEQKIPKEEYELLAKTRKAFRHVFSISSYSYDPNKAQSEQLLECQDLLSEVIDSETFAKSCNIEDRFIISEIDTFFKMYSTAEPEKKKPLTHTSLLTCDSKKISALDLANKIRQNRVERTRKYAKIAELYKKLNGAKEITIKTKSPEDFER